MRDFYAIKTQRGSVLSGFGQQLSVSAGQGKVSEFNLFAFAEYIASYRCA